MADDHITSSCMLMKKEFVNRRNNIETLYTELKEKITKLEKRERKKKREKERSEGIDYSGGVRVNGTRDPFRRVVEGSGMEGLGEKRERKRMGDVSM